MFFCEEVQRIYFAANVLNRSFVVFVDCFAKGAVSDIAVLHGFVTCCI
jgi:hypothetical protein